ncbi:unnamed protein product [Acanthoscelides obtectus]|uniref:Uncharacterized protein n=1 Tax=Acanthoscelides obtectus TaxID=200917 RepID=A0A9P0PAW5_ACAOB|nr:unnamed protein product [Acanthoscelides obtectus]CAK1667694.1 hypothetical protein AOBTE_LOCUS25995 [Acanthoscelides obtectus]
MTGVKRKLRNDWSARNCPTKNSLIEWTRPVYKGTNGSGLVLCKQGSFTADRTTVVEAAVDDQVVRIPLYRHNLNDFKAKYEHWLKRQASVGNKSRTVSNSQGQGKSKESTLSRQRGRPPKTANKLTADKLTARQRTNQLKLDRSARNNAVKRNIRVKIPFKPLTSKTPKQVKPLPKVKNAQTHVKNGKIHNKKVDKSMKKSKLKQSSKLKSKTSVKKLNPKNKTSPYRTMNKPRYCLQMNNNYHESDSQRDIYSFKFTELVKQVKDVKLPSPTWKIKVMVKKGKITTVIFTNKLALERSVSFHADNDAYRTVINNKPAVLLGSPGFLNDLEDTEILLDILQHIDPNSSTILYK